MFMKNNKSAQLDFQAIYDEMIVKFENAMAMRRRTMRVKRHNQIVTRLYRMTGNSIIPSKYIL